MLTTRYLVSSFPPLNIPFCVCVCVLFYMPRGILSRLFCARNCFFVSFPLNFSDTKEPGQLHSFYLQLSDIGGM
jgi:hypothetical protein